VTATLLPSAPVLFIARARTHPDLVAIQSTRVGTKLNATLPATRVQRIGGTPPELWRDDPVLQVEAWAADEGTADLLIRTWVAALPDFRHRAPTGEAVLAQQREYREANYEAHRDRQNAWYAENRDQVSVRRRARRANDPEFAALDTERSAAYHAENRERTLAQQRAYYAENREAVKARQEAYRQANGEAAVQRVREWRKANPEQYAVHMNRRRVREAADADLTAQEWREILAEFDGACAYCSGGELPLVMEHMTPLARGGRHTAANVIPSCQPCNARKHTKTAAEFAARDPHPLLTVRLLAIT
jgi:5-methylcytosine-specific restriction endonuclease McrA